MIPSLLLLLACKGGDDAPEPTGPVTVPWALGHAPTTADLPERRGLQPRRSIIHLHSPLSHDACDGAGWDEDKERLDERCLKEFRQGLCDNAIDVAYVTDHPDFSDAVPFDERLLTREDDEVLGGQANRIHCDSGHEVLLLPGHEDELMPVGLAHPVDADPIEEHRLLNASDAQAIAAMRDAGGLVFQAHTEGRALADLELRQDNGMTGIEIFNLHAMFGPDIRQDDLGLDPLGWVAAIEPFTSDSGTGEPDLFFLGVHQQQDPSLAAFDALLARGPVVGIGGTDAHQNVLNIPLRDGDRGDSYRRMTGWFSNVLLTDGTDPEDYDRALGKGRSYLSFDALGIADFDLFLTAADGTVYEMGSNAPSGTLSLICPTLSPSSPRGEEAPEITVTIYKDGAPWQSECGDFEVGGPAVYRVRADIVPYHLRGFLGENPESWLHPYPWVYSNAIRVDG